MAFDKTKFERVAGGAQKLFIYDGGADTIAVQTGASYFDSKASEVDKGDVIIAKGANNTTIDVLQVTSARNVTPVTVSATEGVTAT